MSEPNETGRHSSLYKWFVGLGPRADYARDHLLRPSLTKEAAILQELVAKTRAYAQVSRRFRSTHPQPNESETQDAPKVQ